MYHPIILFQRVKAVSHAIVTHSMKPDSKVNPIHLKPKQKITNNNLHLHQFMPSLTTTDMRNSIQWHHNSCRNSTLNNTTTAQLASSHKNFASIRQHMVLRFYVKLTASQSIVISTRRIGYEIQQCRYFRIAINATSWKPAPTPMQSGLNVVLCIVIRLHCRMPSWSW